MHLAYFVYVFFICKIISFMNKLRAFMKKFFGRLILLVYFAQKKYKD